MALTITTLDKPTHIRVTAPRFTAEGHIGAVAAAVPKRRRQAAGALIYAAADPGASSATRRLRRAVAGTGLSTPEIADAAGVHRGTVWRWMAGEGRPPEAAVAAVESAASTALLTDAACHLRDLALVLGPAPEVSAAIGALKQYILARAQRAQACAEATNT